MEEDGPLTMKKQEFGNRDDSKTLPLSEILHYEQIHAGT